METLSRSSSSATVVPNRMTRPGQAAAASVGLGLHLPTIEQEPLRATEPASAAPASSSLKLSDLTLVAAPPVSPSQPPRKPTEPPEESERAERRAGSVTSVFSTFAAPSDDGVGARTRNGIFGTVGTSAGLTRSTHSRTSSELSPSFGSALFARKSEDGPISAAMSRNSGSHTSSGGASSASSSDYLSTPAQHPAFFEPRIVKGNQSPWSQSSHVGPPRGLGAERRRDYQLSPAMIDPRFHFPMKRGSLSKQGTGKAGSGLKSSSEQPRTESAGSYVARLGLAPLADDQGHHIPLNPSPSSSPELSRSAPLPSTSPAPPTRLLSAFQPAPPTSFAPRRRSPPRRRSSPKSKARYQPRPGSPTHRRRHRSGGSTSGSSTDRIVPSSREMRASPSAPDLHHPSTPPRTRNQRSYRPSQQAPAGILQPPGPIPARAPTPASTYEAYFLPRPRLALASPQAPSASQLQAEWRRRRAIAKDKAPAREDDEAEQLEDEEEDLSVRRVLRENEESRRERAAWSDSNAHSLGFNLTRKLSLGGGMRRRSRSISQCQAPPPNEWEADSDAQAAALRRRKEKQQVRMEREQRARRPAATGSDTENEGAQTGDEGGYLDPFYSPPTARSFDPFAQAAAEAASPIKTLARKLSGGRRRRSSKSRKASDAGLSSDGGAPKLSSSTRSSRGRRSSEAPPPLPGVAHSPSLADFNASSPVRFVGNRPIRHLRTSPSLDSLSPRHAAAPPQTVYGEALSDLNGAPLHGRKMSITEPAPTNVKQNAALSLPPHLHHLLRSPTAPTTRTLEEQQDVSFLPSRAPPAVPSSDDSHQTSESKESSARISSDSAARLYIVLDAKLAADETAAAQTDGKGKENARPVSGAPSITSLNLHSTTAAPLAWRSRRRSPSVESLSRRSSYPSPEPSLGPSLLPSHRPPQLDLEPSLPPPHRRGRLSKQAIDPLGLAAVDSVTAPSTMDPTATPTFGNKRPGAGATGTYFDLPPATANKDVRGLAMTDADPFAPRGSLDSQRGAEEAGPEIERAQVPMDSPESARSSGGESAGRLSVLEIDEKEPRFDNLFFRPPPSEADRSILPTPTPIDVHRLSGSSRLTSSTFDPHLLGLAQFSEPGDDTASKAESAEIAFVDDGEGSRRSPWQSEDEFEHGDETFGPGARRQLRLSLEEGLPFELEEDERASTRQSDAWATAKDVGQSEVEQGEDHPEEMSSLDGRLVAEAREEPTTSMMARPGPTPAQGDWSTTSFAREYLGSLGSQPASAPAEQSSFLDFSHSRDSRPVVISPTPTNGSAGSARGSFLEFEEDEAGAEPPRQTESRTSFLEDWSPPSSPKRASALSLPVVSSTPVVVASSLNKRTSHLSVDSRHANLGGSSGEGSPALSPMAASFQSDSRLSRLDDFPNPPAAAEPPSASSLLPQTSMRRPRSMPQVFPTHPPEPRGYQSSPLAGHASGRRSSASFLDLQDDHRPLSLATTSSSIYLSQLSAHRPASSSSFVSFFSDTRATMLERGFVFRLEEAEDH